MVNLKQLKTAVLGCVLFVSCCGRLIGDGISSRLNVSTQDGTVTNYPYKLKVTNGSLTDNSDGTMSLTTGAAGGGGGSSSLAVGTGTASNFTNNITSPTAAISFLGSQFGSTASGTTNFITVNTSSFTALGPSPNLSSLSGTVTAGEFPALTGDITTPGGSLATTAAGTQANITNFTSAITHTSSITINTSSAGSNTTNDLFLSVNHPAPTSSSTGGAINVTMTNSTGTAMTIYSNRGVDASGNLVNIRSDNASFTNNALFIDYRGATAAATIKSSVGNTPAGFALNVVGGSTQTSTMQLSGIESTVGTFKITHTSPTVVAGQSDANAAALSIDLKGVGTQAQGIFLNSTDGTTGNLLTVRNQGFHGTTNMVSIASDGTLAETWGIKASTVSVSSNTILGAATYYANGVIAGASMDANELSGTLQAGQFPALTGDVTTTAGSLATTAAGTQGNITTFTSGITMQSTFTVTGASIAINGVANAYPNAACLQNQVLVSNGGTAPQAWSCQGQSGSGGGVIGYSGSGISLASTVYFPVVGGLAPSATESAVDSPSPSGATIANFYSQLSQAVGVGNSVAFTWRKNGVSQSLTCTISGATSDSCNDTSHSFTVSQGDTITIQAVPSGIIGVTPNVVMVTQFGTTGSNGTVNNGTAGQIAYYAAGGTAVSGNNTFTSSMTIAAGVLLGSSGNAVTISSNSVLPGATFYQNGTVTLGAVTASTLQITTLTITGPTYNQDYNTITNTNYVITSTDSLILCNAISNAVTLTLPSASASNGQILTIEKTDGSASSCTIKGAGSDQIVSTGTWYLFAQAQELVIQSTGGINVWARAGPMETAEAYIGGTLAANAAETVATSSNVYCYWYGVSRPSRATGIRCSIGTANGNMDVAIIDSNGNRLASSGSTAMPGTGTQTLTFTSAVNILPGTYGLCVQVSNVTGAFRGLANVLNAFLNTETTMGIPATLTVPGTTTSLGIALEGIVTGGGP